MMLLVVTMTVKLVGDVACDS